MLAAKRLFGETKMISPDIGWSTKEQLFLSDFNTRGKKQVRIYGKSASRARLTLKAFWR